jgi:hypothetical protein
MKLPKAWAVLVANSFASDRNCPNRGQSVVRQVVNLRRIGNLDWQSAFPQFDELLLARRKRSLPHGTGGLTI